MAGRPPGKNSVSVEDVAKAYADYTDALSALGVDVTEWELAVIPGKGYRIIGAPSGAPYPTRWETTEKATIHDSLRTWVSAADTVRKLLPGAEIVSQDEIGEADVTVPVKTAPRKRSAK